MKTACTQGVEQAIGGGGDNEKERGEAKKREIRKKDKRKGPTRGDREKGRKISSLSRNVT